MENKDKKMFLTVIMSVMFIFLIAAVALLITLKKNTPVITNQTTGNSQGQIVSPKDTIREEGLIFETMGTNEGKNYISFIKEDNEKIEVYDFAESGASTSCTNLNNMKFNIEYYVGEDGLNHFVGCSQTEYIDIKDNQVPEDDFKTITDAIVSSVQNNPPLYISDGKAVINERAVEVGYNFNFDSVPTVSVSSNDMNNYIEVILVKDANSNHSDFFEQISSMYSEELNSITFANGEYCGVIVTDSPQRTTELYELISEKTSN